MWCIIDWFDDYWFIRLIHSILNTSTIQYSTVIVRNLQYRTEVVLRDDGHWMRDWRLDSLDSLTRHDSPKSQSHARMHEWIDNNHNLITLSTIDDCWLLIVDCWLREREIKAQKPSTFLRPQDVRSSALELMQDISLHLRWAGGL